MTYRELALHITENLNEQQQNCDVTIFDTDLGEYFPLKEIDIVDEEHELDKYHPVLYIDKT